MVTLQSVKRHTKLHFKFSDIRELRCSGIGARVSECQKIRNGGLDQYSAEQFGRLVFATIRKSVGLKGLNHVFAPVMQLAEKIKSYCTMPYDQTVVLRQAS